MCTGFIGVALVAEKVISSQGVGFSGLYVTLSYQGHVILSGLGIELFCIDRQILS